MATTGAPEGWLEDYFAQGEAHQDIGIIFVHGFTGSPAAMRPWAHFMNERGYTVSVPRLPGHGTRWEDLNHVSWQEWPARVQTEIESLKKRCTSVFIFGLSMGGGTTLSVAASNELAGIVLVNPMIHIPGVGARVALALSPIVHRVRKGLSSVGDDIKAPGVTEWGYDVLPTKAVGQLDALLKSTRANLAKVQAPTLLFHSVDDHVLPVSNSDIIMAEIGSVERQRIEITNSYHVATLDYDAPFIFANALAHVKHFS